MSTKRPMSFSEKAKECLISPLEPQLPIKIHQKWQIETFQAAILIIKLQLKNINPMIARSLHHVNSKFPISGLVNASLNILSLIKNLPLDQKIYLKEKAFNLQTSIKKIWPSEIGEFISIMKIQEKNDSLPPKIILFILNHQPLITKTFTLLTIPSKIMTPSNFIRLEKFICKKKVEHKK